MDTREKLNRIGEMMRRNDDREQEYMEKNFLKEHLQERYAELRGRKPKPQCDELYDRILRRYEAELGIA